MKKLLTCVVFLGISACSSGGPKRVWVDSLTHKDSPPEWMENDQIAWEDDGKVFFRVSHEVRGDERVNGCMDLARLDAQEQLLTEIKNDVRGKIDNAQMSINENAESLLGKARAAEFQGSITGLRVGREYWERYRITERDRPDTERVTCFILAEMKVADYNRVKQSVVNKLQAIDPKIKEAVVNSQVDFFGASKTAAAPESTQRAPASDEPKKN